MQIFSIWHAQRAKGCAIDAFACRDYLGNMKRDGYLAPWEIWNDFVKAQCAKEGWKLKNNDFDKLCCDFYFTKPQTYLQKLLKLPANKTVVIHVDLDTDDEAQPLKWSKGK